MLCPILHYLLHLRIVFLLCLIVQSAHSLGTIFCQVKVRPRVLQTTSVQVEKSFLVFVILEVYQSFVHFLHLIPVVLPPLDVVEVVAGSCGDGVVIADLPGSWNRHFIDHLLVLLLIDLHLQVCVRIEYIQLREVAQRLSQYLLLLQKQVVMGRRGVFQIGENAASRILNVHRGALLLHLVQELFVHLYRLEYAGLLIDEKAFAFVEVEPGVLLDLLEAVAKGGLRHQDVLDQVPHFL